MSIPVPLRNMVEQQIRTWDVLEDRVLDLYYELDRTAFVPPELGQLAYTDMQLDIGHGQCTLEPKVEARILQAAVPALTDNVLHVGTGTGFFAALLGRLCGKLTTYEIVPELAAAARRRLAAHAARNVEVVAGDGLAAAADASYELIILTGSVPEVPKALLARLAAGGRLLAPVGSEPVCSMQLLRQGASRQDLFETWIPRLRNAELAPKFEF